MSTSLSQLKTIQSVKIIFYIFCVFVIAKAYFSNLLLHQLALPSLILPYADNTFWFFHFLGIPQYLVGSFSVSLLFDITMFVSILACLFLKKIKAFPIIFFLLFLCYFITLNSFRNHHAHNLIGVLLMSFSLCFQCSNLFAIGFFALRYYLLFIMSSAALWKLFRGSVFNLEHMSECLKLQHISYLVNNSNNLYADFIYFLINSQFISQTIFIAGFLIQLSFILGFFTEKYDKMLLVLFFTFFIGDYLLMDLAFVELYILSVTLFLYPREGLVFK